MIFKDRILVYTREFGPNSEKLHVLPLPPAIIRDIIDNGLLAQRILEFDERTLEAFERNLVNVAY